jgi:hypothetical protein
LGWENNRSLIYAALFFACALINALGAEIIAVLAFLPVAMALEVTAVNGVKRQSNSPSNTIPIE